MTLMATLAVLAVFVVGGGWMATRFLRRCAHQDADGHSALIWRIDVETNRVRGWCPHCGRVTRGWSYDRARRV